MKLLVGCGHWSLIGGSERYALEVVEALAARGHELVVLHGAEDPAPMGGVTFERFQPLAELDPAPDGRGELRRLLRSHRPSLVFQLTPCAAWVVAEYQRAAPYARFVQDHTLFCPGLNKLLADGQPCRSPLGRVCLERYFLGDGCHGFRAPPGRRPLLKPLARLHAKRRELALHGKARLLLVGSEYMRRELVASGCPPERVHVLAYSTGAATGRTPVVEPPDTTCEFLLRGRGALLFTPARLALPDKGLEHLLLALKRVEHPFRCVVAGTGPAEEWLREKAQHEGLAESVHFAGWLNAGQVEGLYARADLVVFPSVWDEPFGLVGIEAMAHGVPVVAFDVGGVGDWLEEGVGGWRAPRRDVVAMARLIERAIAEPQTARRVGASGRARVERDFRPERYVERLEALLTACA